MDAQKEYESFLDDKLTAIISSISDEGEIETSYSPYVKMGDSFYCYLSAVAKHYSNLYTTKRANILFIEDEGKCSNFYMRKRLKYSCEVSRVDDDEVIFKALHDRFGETITTVRSMGDFSLFKFTPIEDGRFVISFGGAYTVNLSGEVKRVKGYHKHGRENIKRVESSQKVESS